MHFMYFIHILQIVLHSSASYILLDDVSKINFLVRRISNTFFFHYKYTCTSIILYCIIPSFLHNMVKVPISNPFLKTIYLKYYILCKIWTNYRTPLLWVSIWIFFLPSICARKFSYLFKFRHRSLARIKKGLRMWFLFGPFYMPKCSFTQINA